MTRGNNIVTEELPAYCAVALAGLNDLPDTIMTRSIVIRMRRRAPTEKVEPWRLRKIRDEASALKARLEKWSQSVQRPIAMPELPEGVEDRDADVWEAPVAVADLAGGLWPERARRSAVALVADKSADQTSLGIMLLRDLRTIFANEEHLTTEAVLARLHDLDESPWLDLRGKPLDARGLANRLKRYDVKPKKYRDGHNTHRGYLVGDLADPWTRYLPPSPEKDGTPGTTEHDTGTRSTVPHVPEESEDEAPDQLDLDTKATTGSAPEQTMCQTCEDAGCSDCEEWLPPEER